jgi:pyruvate, water dikinase
VAACVIPTALEQAGDAQRFGGKAAALASALRAELPVPGGWALDHTLVDAIAAGDPDAARAVTTRLAHAPGPFAVRSSAIGEDGTSSSFAGQHLTRLGVAPEGVLAAVAAVRQSVHAPAALAYRARRGIAGPPRAGVVIQEMISADTSAVVFTRDPLDGRDVVVIEASFGLGESVVNGSVIPDRFVLDRGGGLLSCQAGDKDRALLLIGGCVVEQEIAAPRSTMLCLDQARLAQIHQLVGDVDRVWPAPHDLEIAFLGARIHLLQRRPLTNART